MERMKLFGKLNKLIILVFAAIYFMQCNAIAAAPTTLPVISRGVPAFASSDIAANANDSSYGTTWKGTVPGWIAYDLSGVPAAQRGQVDVAWYNNDTYDYDHSIKGTGSYGSLKSYTIEGNAAAGGGSAPTSGWVTLATVSNNIYHSRQHSVNLSGYNWLRLNISAADSQSGNYASINLDVHNASQGLQDSWIFYGDSITAGGMVLSGGGNGTFAQMVNAVKPNYFPAAECGGVGSLLSSHGAQYINTWLSVFPGKYVGISYGTNDAWGNQAGTATFYKNMETMVKAVINAGKIPVVPKIPWARLTDIQTYAPSYNAQIDALYTAYPQIIKGPDLWTYFQSNQSYISSDNVHPTADGFNAMRQQWANAMVAAVYSSQPTVKYGDLNSDSSVDSTDYALMKKFILGTPTTIDQIAADLNGDNSINSVDYALLKQFLLGMISKFPVEN
jgi:lysophospholipase L1-like esterase